MRRAASKDDRTRAAFVPAARSRWRPAACAATLAGVLVAGAWPGEAAACSSCGCILATDWVAQGFAAASGFRLDLRFDYFDQDQLRTGTGTVDRGAITFPTDREIQRDTVNRNLTLSADYSPDADWGVNLQVPFFDRTHGTVASGDVALSTSSFRRVGDIRVIGRYQGFSPDHTTGIQIGFKLATGAFDERFVAGPQAGAPLDRGLQPGTGTTDALLGAYHYGALGGRWTYFAQVTLQQPLGARDGFEPGAGLNASLGVRYAGYRSVVPQVQLNVRAEGRESGRNADVANSGATLAYVGPGLTVVLGRAAQAFAFVEIPVYQNVNGYQLAPRFTTSVGIDVRP